MRTALLCLALAGAQIEAQTAAAPALLSANQLMPGLREAKAKLGDRLSVAGE
jgi:hypothetical protein